MANDLVGACREMTFEEEAELYENETYQLFIDEEKGSEPPFANCIVRRGKRVIEKARREIKDIRDSAEKAISVLKDEYKEKEHLYRGAIDEQERLRMEIVSLENERDSLNRMLADAGEEIAHLRGQVKAFEFCIAKGK